MSSLAWLDHSEHDRRRALDVISLFGERDTRDELGIGTIRDAFADLFFPGTSTIQTRARYLLFVPWIYQRLEAGRTPTAKIREKARRAEIRLIDVLADSKDPDGTIGIEARARLKRLPSNIYWQGLLRLGIRLFSGSQEQYHRSFDKLSRVDSSVMRTDDGEPVNGTARSNWHPGIPSPPKEFPDDASFTLTATEGRYLQDRIMNRAPRSLLAFLVERGMPADSVDFPWEQPQYGEFPARVRAQLEHARCFSEAIHGSALLYNLMLAEEVNVEEWTDFYRERLADWATNLDQRGRAMASWDRQEFWKLVQDTGARVPLRTRSFIDRWLTLILERETPEDVAESTGARKMIRARERTLKGPRARLGNERALELWQGAAGAAQIDYRWQVTERIVADILTGLER